MRVLNGDFVIPGTIMTSKKCIFMTYRGYAIREDKDGGTATLVPPCHQKKPCMEQADESRFGADCLAEPAIQCSTNVLPHLQNDISQAAFEPGRVVTAAEDAGLSKIDLQQSYDLESNKKIKKTRRIKGLFDLLECRRSARFHH